MLPTGARSSSCRSCRNSSHLGSHSILGLSDAFTGVGCFEPRFLDSNTLMGFGCLSFELSRLGLGFEKLLTQRLVGGDVGDELGICLSFKVEVGHVVILEVVVHIGGALPRLRVAWCGAGRCLLASFARLRQLGESRLLSSDCLGLPTLGRLEGCLSRLELRLEPVDLGCGLVCSLLGLLSLLEGTLILGGGCRNVS